jgi:SAM-dependent methyltransferase
LNHALRWAARNAGDPRRVPELLAGWLRFVRDWRAYSKLPGAEPLKLRDSYPCLFDRHDQTPFDPHYFYQAAWLGRLIERERPLWHVDVGSDYRMVGMLACQTKVAFLDVRPLNVAIDTLTPLAGDVLRLPFASGSIRSLSCLHVAEHIGLGRYGDALNPRGTVEAAAELARVLAPGGRLYFSLPVGRNRVEFSAHRIHGATQARALFPDLDLAAFSAVDDRGKYWPVARPVDFDAADYACGMYLLKK